MARLAIIGENAGRPIIAGLFRLHDEIGLHLADATVKVLGMGMLPSFSDFAANALSAGWRRERVEAVFSEVRHDVSDAGLKEAMRRV